MKLKIVKLYEFLIEAKKPHSHMANQVATRALVLSSELIEEAIVFGDGANASEVRRLWNNYIFACCGSDVKSTGSSNGEETPLLTLDDF